MSKKISIIIPCFNAQNTIAFLLDSLQGQLKTDEELIVVDDGSTDASATIAKTFNATLLSTEGRKGPAAARNIGATKANGDLLLFLDADVIAPKHLVAHVRERFEQESGLKALSGIYDSEPANDGFFHQLKAVQAAVWFSGVKQYESLETACAAIRKEAFDLAGGFDETFTGADVEDYEFGYRLGGPIEIDHRMAVRHHFPDFWTNTKNYFHRARHWAGLYKKRRRFDSGSATSKSGAIITLLPALILLFLLLGIIGCCPVSFSIAILMLVVWLVAKWPVVRELIYFRKSLEALPAYLYLYVGDLAASAGALTGLVK